MIDEGCHRGLYLDTDQGVPDTLPERDLPRETGTSLQDPGQRYSRLGWKCNDSIH